MALKLSVTPVLGLQNWQESTKRMQLHDFGRLVASAQCGSVVMEARVGRRQPIWPLVWSEANRGS